MSDAPARRTDLTKLPPAWVGVPCELVTAPGMDHGADGLAPKAQSMKDFRDSMTEHLRTHL